MTQHVYPPQTVAAMTATFDRLCESVSISGDDLRRQLALIILRHADSGVQDPEQLSEMAFHEFAGLGGSSIGALRSRSRSSPIEGAPRCR